MDKQRLADLAKNAGHPAVGPELMRLLVGAVLELAGAVEAIPPAASVEDEIPAPKPRKRAKS